MVWLGMSPRPSSEDDRQRFYGSIHCCPTKIRSSTFLLWVGVIIPAAVWEFKPIISAYWEWIRLKSKLLQELKKPLFRTASFWWWILNVDRSEFTRRGKNSAKWMFNVPTGSSWLVHCLTTSESQRNCVRCQNGWDGPKWVEVHFCQHSLNWGMNYPSWAHSTDGVILTHSETLIQCKRNFIFMWFFFYIKCYGNMQLIRNTLF